MTVEEFIRKHSIICLYRTNEVEELTVGGVNFRYNVAVEMTEHGLESLLEMSDRDNRGLELIHRETYEHHMREKYPGIKTAWEKYQLLLKIAND